MDYIVENVRPEIAFAMVPRALFEDRTLSAHARLALIYICSQPTGWITRVADVQDAIGVGQKAWRRISKELRASGAAQLRTHADRRTGRVYGQRLVFSWAKWVNIPETSKRDASAQPVDNSTETSKRDVAERDVDSCPKGTGTPVQKGPNYQERKNKSARARAGMEPAGRGQSISPSAPPPERAGLRPDAESEERVIPSLEEKRRIARSMGLDPENWALSALSGASTEPDG